MIICLHIPKTGGTSFRFILENSFGVFNCHTNQTNRSTFTEADLRFVKKFFPGLRSITGHNIVDPTELRVKNPFYATILREPVARVISHYQYSVQRGNNQASFEESLRRSENLENLQTKLIAGGRDIEKAKRFLAQSHFVGLTEKFDLSLRVLERLSPWKLNLHYKKKVVASDYQVKESVQRDERMLELAREYNKLDIELYEFARKEIFPALCQKAGVNPNEPVPSYATYRHERLPKYQVGRFYNRMFRQICKFRYQVLMRDPRPLLGNVAEDIFAPLLQKTARF